MRYKVAVIGGGPGGCSAALKAAKAGLETVLIERGQLGGVCLNEGCIPTKSMLASARLFGMIKRAREFGIEINSEPAILLERLKSRQEAIVARIRNSLESLLEKHRVKVVYGQARFSAPNVICVSESKEVEADYVVIASGSQWKELEGLPLDGKTVVSSKEMLAATEVPHSLLVVGGGAIGCELATLFNLLGSDVTIVEAADSILPTADTGISRYLARIFKQRGISIITGATVKSIDTTSASSKAYLSNGEQLLVDKVLVSTGRQPLTAGLNCEGIGLAFQDGAIKVNQYLQTSIPSIFAVGDVIGGRMLAHVASYEGGLAVSNILGDGLAVDLSVVPQPVFTIPEIAYVGATEKQIKAKEVEYSKVRINFTWNGKAVCDGETDGFIILYAASDNTILGAHVIGSGATLLCAEVALAMKNRLPLESITNVIHAHPSLSEVVFDAAAALVEGL